MALIFESKFFLVESADPPLVDRNDGGHIMISPKTRISTRQQLEANDAIELMRLTIVTGEAMHVVMNEHGVDIGRINYQDNGNWSVFSPEGPALHIHLFGRAKSAVHQKYGQALFFPHRDEHPDKYKSLKALEPQDNHEIHTKIRSLLEEKRFSDYQWKSP
jgi:diadenosine tetraphosphate (Ap4A) HIT family hydrolase